MKEVKEYRVFLFPNSAQEWQYKTRTGWEIYKYVYNTGDEVYFSPEGKVSKVLTRDGVIHR